MADEQQKPEDINEEDVATTPDYADAEQEVEELEEIETGGEGLDEAGTEFIEATAEVAEDNPVAEAWDEGVESVMEATDELVDGHHESDGHHYTDEVVIPYFGHVGTMPGGIYTFIFAVLAVITLVEVLITELLPNNAITIALLVILSLGKAYLVIMYYMHLNNDNPIFRLTLILPLIVVLLSTLYLLGVPAGGGLGYN